MFSFSTIIINYFSHLTKKLVSDKGIIESLRRQVQEHNNEVHISYCFNYYTYKLYV